MKDTVPVTAPSTSRPRFDHAVAFRDDHAISRAEFDARVGAAATELRRRRERSWLIACDDAFYFLCGFFGALYAGKRLIIPPNFQPGTLASFEAQAQGWIVDTVDRAVGKHSARLAVESLHAEASAESIVPDTAVIDLYTSGTTGAPKRVPKHPRQLTAEVDVLEALWGKELGTAAVVSTVPHHHIYGLLFRLLWPLRAQRAFDVLPCSSPDELLQRLRKFGRAVIVSSPAQLSRWPELMDLTALAPHAAAIFSSGGPLPAAVAKAYERALGFAPTEVYGSSETGGIAWRVQGDAADSQAWTPSPRVDVRVDADSTLHVRSPFVGGDAWFAMADAAQPLTDGRFLLLGRLDRIVKIEEKRLSLPELEQRLTAHPWVADAGVAVLEGKRRLLGAVVVLTAAGRERLQGDGKRQISGELKRFLSQYYEPSLLPRRWRFVEAMPHNDSGKISSAALAALFSALD